MMMLSQSVAQMRVIGQAKSGAVLGLVALAILTGCGTAAPWNPTGAPPTFGGWKGAFQEITDLPITDQRTPEMERRMADARACWKQYWAGGAFVVAPVVVPWVLPEHRMDPACLEARGYDLTKWKAWMTSPHPENWAISPAAGR